MPKNSNVMFGIDYDIIQDVTTTIGNGNSLNTNFYPESVVILTDLITGKLPLKTLREDVQEAIGQGGFVFLVGEPDDKQLDKQTKIYRRRYLRRKNA